jgi:hypothetical protein
VDSPIQVSAPGTSVLGAVGKDITFSTKYPFAKIDSTKSVSFKITNILFSSDTANPDGVTNTTNSVLIYSFAHGYTYVPSTWFLVSVNGFTSVAGTEGYFLVGGGDIPANGSAYLSVQVDSTNVYFYINKIWQSSLGFSAPSVFGLTLAIRSSIFVNDLLGMDVPSQA